jgi:hypothetical protein
VSEIWNDSRSCAVGGVSESECKIWTNAAASVELRNDNDLRAVSTRTT